MLILVFYLHRAMGGFIVIWKFQDLFTKIQTTYFVYMRKLYITGIVLTETEDGRWCRTPLEGESFI